MQNYIYIPRWNCIFSRRQNIRLRKYPPLTENGQEEIEKVCEYLKKRGIKNDKIFTSPAVRCIQSVEPITKLFKKDFEVLDNLYVRKCGCLNGKTSAFSNI